MLTVRKRRNGETTVLDLEGDIIMGGGSLKLREAVTELTRTEKNNILLNFQKVRYLDSSGTGELISLCKLLEESGGNLKISNLSPKVEEVLALSSLLPILDVYEDETSALNG